MWTVQETLPLYLCHRGITLEYRIEGVSCNFWIFHGGQLLDTPFIGFDSWTVTRILENMLRVQLFRTQEYFVNRYTLKIGTDNGRNRNSMLSKMPKYDFFSFGSIFGYDRYWAVNSVGFFKPEIVMSKKRKSRRVNIFAPFQLQLQNSLLLLVRLE